LTGQATCKKSGGGGLLGFVSGVISAVSGAVALIAGALDADTIAVIFGGIAAISGSVALAADWSGCIRKSDKSDCIGAILGSIGTASGLGSVALELKGLTSVTKIADGALSAVAAKLGLGSLTVDGVNVYTAPKPCS
jgi:hypothetical protein